MTWAVFPNNLKSKQAPNKREILFIFLVGGSALHAGIQLV